LAAPFDAIHAVRQQLVLSGKFEHLTPDGFKWAKGNGAHPPRSSSSSADDFSPYLIGSSMALRPNCG
jgi:hypothetical protein